MDFIKRFGTIKHKFKVEFYIGQLSSSGSFKGNLSIIIKRGILFVRLGDHKQNTEQIIQLDEKRKADFKGEKLTFEALTLFYDEQQKLYQEKIGEIRVILTTKKAQKKLLGVIPFDLAQYANSNQPNVKQKHKLLDSPEKTSFTLEYQIFIKLIGEASETNKSIAEKQDKKQRNQSSLTKFTNFVGGIFSSNKDNQNNTIKNSNESPSKQQLNQPIKKKENNIKTEKSPKINNKNTKEEQEQQQKINNKKLANSNVEEINLNDDQLDDKMFYFDQPIKKTNQRQTNTAKPFLVKSTLPQQKKEQEQSQQSNLQKSTNNKFMEKIEKQNKKLKENCQNLNKQIIKLKQQNDRKSKEIQKLTNSINLFKQEKQKDRDSVMEHYESHDQLTNKIINLERQKGELSISMNQMEKKFKMQLKELNETINQIKEQKNTINQEAKAQLKRVKDQSMINRTKIESLTQQLNQVVKRNNIQLSQNKKLGQTYQKLKNKFIDFKFKICQQLNIAFANDYRSIIELLTRLNQI